MMNAAVLDSPTGTPRFAPFAEPTPSAGEVIARVRAAGLHPLVRGHAAGAHYSSSGGYPRVVGLDGVAELPDGRLAYFGWLRPPYGTFAERAAVDPAMVLPLPPGLSPEVAAAIVNPAMSGWLALQLRAHLVSGERVLVLGATGASGGLAVQIARALGASHVIAAGRNPAALERIGPHGELGTRGADVLVRLDAPAARDQLARSLAGGVDVVLDYVWGAPAAATFDALLAARATLGDRRVRYVNIGGSAGAQATLPAAALRALDLVMLGSGFGSIRPDAIRPELPKLLELAARGTLTIDVDRVPLADVADAWATPATGGKRAVIVP